MNLALNLTGPPRAGPDGLALVCGETRLTYADLDAVSAAWRRGCASSGCATATASA